MARSFEEGTVCGPITLETRLSEMPSLKHKLVTYKAVEGEAFVKRHNVIEHLNLFRRKRDIKCLKVLVEVFDLPSANDWEDVRSLLHEIGNSN
jgi:hypothetical protein